MVFGFGEGKIELKLPKTSFLFNEKIRGKLTLQLNQPKKAKQLRVMLVAEEERRYMTQNAQGRRVTRAQKAVLYSTEAVLIEEKEYPKGRSEYAFALQVPDKSALPTQPQLGGAAQRILNAVMLLSGNRRQVKWFVKAVLDIPRSMDIAKSVQISVA